MKVPMGPPPPKNPNPNSEPPSSAIAAVADKSDAEQEQPVADEEPQADVSIPNPNSSSSRSQRSVGATIPYSVPPWSEPPTHPFLLEVLKDGAIIEQLHVSDKGAYMFGRIDMCDFVLEHPTISRFHAVLQYRNDGEAFLYDLGSTHGSFINKNQVKAKVYTKINVGDVIRFGHSSRLYIFQGPSELMPPEGELEKIRKAKLLREEMIDRESSLARARAEASVADGISWGMDEDAIDETPENDADEVTWQTYKGQLTERQEKTRGKILKRLEKVANMKKEIDAIRVKDISQGGLTQGQQTQIARNEQRINQIMEELDSLEETLNESILESIGARSGKVSHGKKKGNVVEDEDDMLSDDDDFYDRTKKKRPVKNSADQQAVETADSLLDKKEVIIKEMEEKNTILQQEQDKLAPNAGSSSEGVDDLDAYMSGLSSQLVIDKTIKIQKEISELQTELDRITYLLKIADPLGDASRKRERKPQEPKLSQPVIDMRNKPQPKQKKPAQLEKSTSAQEKKTEPEQVEEAPEIKESKPVKFTAVKPQWLGDVKNMKSEDDHAQDVHVEATDADNFVDYKDRMKVLESEPKLEQAAPGLIIRKRKSEAKPGETVDKAPKVEGTSSSDAESTAADAVALLLKHKRGYVAFDDETGGERKDPNSRNASGKEISQPKRVLGPSRPDFLAKSPEYEAWMPPEGQTGDGRTSLNDRLGY